MKSPLDWVFVCGLIGLIPLVSIEARLLWQLKHYQFFPIAWAAFAAIVYLRGQVADAEHPFRKILGYAVLLGTLAVTVMAALLVYPKVGQVALIGLCLGWMLLRLGGNHWSASFAWIMLLLITVRLPVTMDQMLVNGLQAVSSQSASRLLDLTGIPHLATGNIIEIRPGKLFVEEACSGVDSFYALTAVALMLSIWQQRGFLVSLLTLASVPLWAWFGNVIRLYLLAYLYNNWDINLTEGWEHTVLGLVIFGVAFGGLLTMQETLSRLLYPLPGGEDDRDWASRFYNWLVTWPAAYRVRPSKSAGLQADAKAAESVKAKKKSALAQWAVPGIAMIAFLAGGLLTAGPALGFGSRKVNSKAAFDKGLVDTTFTADDLPKDFGGMSMRNFEISHRERNSVFGAHSATWVFQDQAREIVISLDFPWSVFHPLEVCYISTGSKVQGDINQLEVLVEEESLFISEVRLKDLFGEHSYLVYSEFNDSGVSAERAEIFSFGTFFNRGMFRRSIGLLYQLQILVPDAATLTDAERERYQALLANAYKILLPKVQELVSLDREGRSVAKVEQE